MAGFDAVSNHVGLLCFSILLDILLWFGPHVRVLKLLEAWFEQANAFPEIETLGTMEMLRTGGERLNLLSALRTFPIGVPSLLAGRSPMETPLANPLVFEVSNLTLAVFLWLLFVLIGLAVGTLYFSLISQTIYAEKVSWQQALRDWPWHFGQVILLTIFVFFIFAAFLLPVTCLLTMFLILGIGSQLFPLILALIFGGVLIWLLIPLFFSPHGIFTNHFTMWESVLRGIQLSRSMFTSTGLLILSVVILSEGLRLLWNIPAENSWLMLVGVFGHAFVTAGLLAATFFYYREANSWLQRLRAEKLRASGANLA